MKEKFIRVFGVQPLIWALILGANGPAFLAAKERDVFSWKKAAAIELNSRKSLPILNSNEAKLYLVDFWASWCGPCQESFPFLDKLQKQFLSQGLVVVGISLDSEIAEAQDFAQKNKVKYALYMDQSHSFRESLAIQALPFIYFLNGKGEVLSEHRGFKKTSREEIEKEIIRLMELQKK